MVGVKKEPGIKKETTTTKDGTANKSITAKSRHGGAKALELAKETFDKKKAEMVVTPSNWPSDCVVDNRWCSWLPQDWTPALKMTIGGLLLDCYMGPPPDRKRFFHKKQLEAYLGRSLSVDERGSKPLEMGDLDPKMFLKRTDVMGGADYINARCHKVHGMSVEEAITSFKCEHTHEKEKNYTVADLKYDIKWRRLELVAERPSQSSRPAPAPATPARKRPAPATPAKQDGARASSSKRAAPATPSKPDSTCAAPSTPQRIPATPSKRECARAAPSTPVKTLKAPAATKSVQAAKGPSVAELFRSCYTPLKNKAASGLADEQAIYALIGIGANLGLDGTMLKTLPQILKKAPSERGDFGKFVMDQFEKELAKAKHA